MEHVIIEAVTVALICVGATVAIVSLIVAAILVDE